jgi:hypothetical protein
MAEYIERTEELMLAMNAGARAIENTRRYHGTVYSKDVFSETPQEIPYLLAAKVLREVSDAPTVDAVVVTRCKDCKYSCKDETGRTCEGYWYELSEFAVSVEDDDFCSYGKRKPSADG